MWHASALAETHGSTTPLIRWIARGKSPGCRDIPTWHPRPAADNDRRDRSFRRSRRAVRNFAAPHYATSRANAFDRRTQDVDAIVDAGRSDPARSESPIGNQSVECNGTAENGTGREGERRPHRRRARGEEAPPTKGGLEQRKNGDRGGVYRDPTPARKIKFPDDRDPLRARGPPDGAQPPPPKSNRFGGRHTRPRPKRRPETH